MLLISPLYRYAMGRCCREETHLTNFTEVDYTKKFANTLQSLGNSSGVLCGTDTGKMCQW